MTTGMDDTLRFTVLGRLAARRAGREFDLGAPGPRALLGHLLLRANVVVRPAELFDVLWGPAPPATAGNVVQAYVGRLRRVLEPGRAPRGTARVLAFTDGGYLLRLAPGQLDLDEFHADLALGRGLLGGGDLPGAADAFRRALDRWTGPALAGLPDGPQLGRERARLEESRVQAFEELAAVELALGRPAGVIAQLTELTAGHPTRERLCELLMTALCQAGRPADALTAYHGLRHSLVGLTGLDPGPAVQRLHQRILTGAEPGAGPGAGSGRTTAPAQLPLGPVGFTGRVAELAAVDRLGAGGLTVAAVTGPAGVGKSALALHWARRAAGRYPDGQLFADLRGFDEAAPVCPEQLLGEFLAGLGVPADGIPAGGPARAALYRSVLAARRVLVVLDNARDSAQVRPFLPGTPSCALVVTSRNRLDSLTVREGALPVRLGVLDAAEAEALLAAGLGADRVAAEPGAARELAVLCDGLPLALRIAACRLAEHPGRPISAAVAELDDERRRLAALSAEDIGVSAALALTYRALPAGQARLLRLLGLHRGAAVDAHAAAALAGCAPAEAAGQLAGLAGTHLTSESAPGRHARHDLIRLYSRQLAETEEPAADRSAAAARLLDYYLDTLVHTRPYWNPGTPAPPGLRVRFPPVRPRRFADRAAMTAWFEEEDLTSAVETAAALGEHQRCWWLARELWPYYYGRRTHAEWAHALRLGLASALAVGAERGEMVMRAHLATALGLGGDPEAAVEQHTLAVATAERLGDRLSAASMRVNLGAAHALTGGLDLAVEHYRSAAATAHALGAGALAARCLANMAELALRRGDPAAALRHVDEALAAAPSDAVWGQPAELLLYRGQAHRGLGRPGEAAHALRRAVATAGAGGQRHTEAEARFELGSVLRDADPEAAGAEWRAARALAAGIGSPLTVALDALLAPGGRPAPGFHDPGFD
ncbi:BTAD domain-containing putative transcriptional regulator [Longispora sp. NPDC051575]|uniref:AfsR/SARP family transcriptional regulator n=1 Tax=Longispora sp. NPDC051575 TaxID=3154943 RepID=UPI00341DB8AB